MRSRLVRPLVVAALLVTGVTAPVVSSSAASTTWTRITTPSGTSYTATNPTFSVAGTTSSGVSNVDIDCVSMDAIAGQQSVATLLSNVKVNAGRFTATVPSTGNGFLSGTCRLHAVPTGTTTNGYYAPYSGPVLYLKIAEVERSTDASKTPVGFAAIDTRGSGSAVIADTGTCPNALVGNVEGPSLSTVTQGGCAFALLPENEIADPAPASSITVDGHNAYLPSGVQSYLDQDQGLSVVPAKLNIKVGRPRNGDLVVTESAPLQRCSPDNTFPPTSTTCKSLVSTGVTFTRVASIVLGSHQISLRDTFASAGGSHRVGLQYTNLWTSYGDVPPDNEGFVVPPRRSGFVAAPAGRTVKGLGTKAATVLLRSDRFAATDDPQAATQGFTWSKAPSQMQFGTSTPYVFTMDYALSVPSHGSTALGFALSDSPTTSGVATLAASAVADMTNAPSITSPRNGATVAGRSVTVTGSVAAGANGLPRSVTVDGHAAKLTRDSATKATWKVTVAASYGTHTLTATATDTAGNQAQRSIRLCFVKK